MRYESISGDISFHWESYEYEISGRMYQLINITDKDRLFDQILGLSPDHPAIQDEQIPYWTDLWPSSIGLSAFLLERPEILKNRSVVEIGSGMGLCGMIASQLGAKVVLTDYLKEASEAAAILWSLNGLDPPEFKVMDIRNPDPCLASDIILASDVIYEKRMHDPLINTFQKLSHEDSIILMSEPQRKYSAPFFDLLASSGYKWERSEYNIIQYGRSYNISVFTIQETL